MQTQFFPGSGRFIKDIGWLKSHFYFSFSNYYNPMRSAFGTLLAFNDDYVESGKGFGIHPHANMEIISVLLQGKMNHIDSMGYKTIIEEGGVQIMSAGSGLMHEEYSIGDDTVNFLQIWIQPKLQGITPRYQQRSFPKAARRDQLKTIISNEEGMEHCWINQNARISLGYYETAQQLRYAFNPVNKCLFIFCLDGKMDVAGTPLEAKDGIGVWETDKVTLTIEPGAEFIVIETPINQN
ncbi:MAG: pirin family protein [Ferruginibacter sp.]|nr:pirin family protein [Ferruginibacter sp.]